MRVTISLDLDDRKDKLSYEYIYAQPAIHSLFENFFCAISNQDKFPADVAADVTNLLTKMLHDYNVQQLLEEQRALNKEKCECKADTQCDTCDRWT